MHKNSKNLMILFAVVVLVSLTVGIVSAAPVTQNINYQGKLTDAAGNPLTGTYPVTFKLYSVSAGGTALATDTRTVQASKGLFNTQITADPSFFDGRALWLGIKVDADAEMTPRQELRPVPYALGLRPWVVGASFTTNSAGTSYNDLRSGVNVSTVFDYNPGVRINTGGDLSVGVYAETAGTYSQGVYAHTSGPDSNGVYAHTSGPDSNGVYAHTSGPDSNGVSAYTSGTSSYGVYASTTNASSTGVRAQTLGQYSDGVSAYTTNTNSRGVYGESNKYVGVWGKGVWGGKFETNQAGYTGFIPNGIEVSTAFDNNRGIIVTTSGTNSPGVTSQTSKDGSNGVYSTTAGTTSHAVYGSATGPTSNGVVAYSSQWTAVYADTLKSDHMYGVYTPDYMSAARYDTNAGDVAEFMPVAENVQPGTVLVIGKDGKLQVSTIGYDTRVAGIVSSAPGVSLGTKEGGNLGEALIAVSGRVPCKVDASYGAIHPGDILTSSNTPGFAMKAQPVNIGGVEIYKPSTVLGKAMGSLESGTGAIEVLVTLQ